jgi:glycosyltransferase involved in cell wall biosynthesis
VSVPEFSVVIPLYNKVQHIKRALDSALAQTYRDFEIIVVNDGSTDGSEKVVEEYSDPRIRLVHREHVNSWGGHAARNLGIAEARADLIAFLDADDEWLPEYLANIRRLAEKYPECGAYSTGYRMVIKGGRTVAPRHTGIPAAPWEGVIPNYLRSRLKSYMITTSSTAVKKDVFAQVGVFPVGERRSGDDDMWMRIALRYDIAYSHYCGLVYHCDAGNRISDDKALPFKLRLFDTLGAAAESGNLRPGISRDDVFELRNAFILVRLAEYLLDDRIGLEEAGFWIRQTASTKRYQREWMELRTVADAPRLLPAWRLKTRLHAALYRFGVRRPRFLSRNVNLR